MFLYIKKAHIFGFTHDTCLALGTLWKNDQESGLTACEQGGCGDPG